jgi:hypothetical protein
MERVDGREESEPKRTADVGINECSQPVTSYLLPAIQRRTLPVSLRRCFPTRKGIQPARTARLSAV